jgi:hypothetical protein
VSAHQPKAKLVMMATFPVLTSLLIAGWGLPFAGADEDTPVDVRVR